MSLPVRLVMRATVGAYHGSDGGVVLTTALFTFDEEAETVSYCYTAFVYILRSRDALAGPARGRRPYHPEQGVFVLSRRWTRNANRMVSRSSSRVLHPGGDICLAH